MSLDPAKQYLYWIISLASTMGFSIWFLVMFADEIITGTGYSLLAISGVATFCLLFLSVVIFLTVIWLHMYKTFKLKK
jgi:multidrug transporter EmrE-like cation transporter